MDRILLAVDGSDHAIRAAAFAGELSFRFEAPVDIINVIPEGSMVIPGPVHEYAALERVYLTQRDLLKSAGTELIARATRTVKEAGGDLGETEVVVGSTAHSIVSFADKRGADCIVMGRRGLGDMRGMLMGSVTHKVGQLTDITLITTE